MRRTHRGFVTEENLKQIIITVFGEDALVEDANLSVRAKVGDFNLRVLLMDKGYINLSLEHMPTHRGYSLMHVETLTDVENICMNLLPVLREISELSAAIGPLLDMFMRSLTSLSALLSPSSSYSDAEHFTMPLRSFRNTYIGTR